MKVLILSIWNEISRLDVLALFAWNVNIIGGMKQLLSYHELLPIPVYLLSLQVLLHTIFEVIPVYYHTFLPAAVPQVGSTPAGLFLGPSCMP